jgi:hypothetical protein
MQCLLDHGCVVCEREFKVHTPPEIHHIDGKTKPNAHLNSIPLCTKHHRGGEDSEIYTARHPFKFRFEERYGTETELLEHCRSKIFG